MNHFVVNHGVDRVDSVEILVNETEKALVRLQCDDTVQ